jgi:hypothetical protein
MPFFSNAAEVYRLLDKSNCRKCGELTCLAFAGAVYLRKKRLKDCPKIPPAVIERYSAETPFGSAEEAEGGQRMKRLQAELARQDLRKLAERVGAQYVEDRLTLKILGKDFGVDPQGRFITDIHVNPWVVVPFLSYILHSQGRSPTGRWVSFRDLPEGRWHYPLFQKRCEVTIKRVADGNPDFFHDLIHLFDAREVEPQYRSDISVTLLPLPRVPIMICYWLPEEGMGSNLNLFFDETAGENLSTEAAFMLGVGLAEMFRKITLTHGVEPGI